MPDPPSPSTDGRPARWWDSLRSRLSREPPPPSPPWRVEGLPERRADPSQQRRPNSRFWWVLLGLLAINWIVSGLLLGPAPRTPVSYTFFVGQVDTSNVKEITSTGDLIEGEFKREVAYPAGSQPAEQVVRFTTQRPSFANDALFQKLQATGVVVNAKPPDQPAPVVAAAAGRVRPDAAVPRSDGVVVPAQRRRGRWAQRHWRYRPVPSEALPA